MKRSMTKSIKGLVATIGLFILISFVVHGKSFGIIREDTDKLEKKNAVESIIIALRDEDSDVRLSIAESPGMIGDRRVDEHLFTAVLVSMGLSVLAPFCFKNIDTSFKKIFVYLIFCFCLSSPLSFACLSMLIERQTNVFVFVNTLIMMVIISLVAYNIPLFIFLSMPFVHRKWLRARWQAKHFICLRCFRRFILGSGLPCLVRWSGRILLVEKPRTHDTFEDYFVCKTCGSKEGRIEGVKKVVGLIGADVKDYRKDGEIFYVSLWNEQEKKACNADIDILEIRESDGVSYDYAVNAVLNVLKNDVSRPRDYVKGIPVIIRGNPPLSENSRMILTHEFGGIKK